MQPKSFFKTFFVSAIILGCLITPTSATSNPFDISGTQPNSKIVVTGMNDVVFSRYQITPTLEDYLITKLSVKLVGADDAFDPNLVRNVKAIELTYKNMAGEEAKATSPLASAGIANFNDIAIFVKRRTTASFEIGADVNTIAAGAISGSEIKIGLDTNSQITAVGQSSGETLNNQNIRLPSIETVNPMTIRKTQPVVGLADMTTGLANGLMRLYGLSVVADASGDIAIKRIGFGVSGNLGENGSISGWRFYEGSSQINNVTCTPDGSFVGGSFGGTVWAEWNGTREGNVSAGNKKTFYLRADVSGVTTRNQISTFIESDDALNPNTGNYATIKATGSNFVWSDESGIPHSLTSTDWTNGYLVEDFPLEAQTLKNYN